MREEEGEVGFAFPRLQACMHSWSAACYELRSWGHVLRAGADVDAAHACLLVRGPSALPQALTVHHNFE